VGEAVVVGLDVVGFVVVGLDVVGIIVVGLDVVGLDVVGIIVVVLDVVGLDVVGLDVVGTGVGDLVDLSLAGRLGDLVDLAFAAFATVGPFVIDDFRVLACAESNKVVARMQMTRVRVVPIFIVSVWVGERDREGGVRPSQKCDCRESMRIV